MARFAANRKNTNVFEACLTCKVGLEKKKSRGLLHFFLYFFFINDFIKNYFNGRSTVLQLQKWTIYTEDICKLSE